MPRTLPSVGRAAWSPAGCLQSPPPQFLEWAEIIEQSPADITLWLLPKDVPPPSPTKAFPDQPPSLPFLSHAFHLLKEPRENSVLRAVLGYHGRSIRTPTDTGFSLHLPGEPVARRFLLSGQYRKWRTHSDRGTSPFSSLTQVKKMIILMPCICFASPFFRCSIRKFPFSPLKLQISRTFPNRSL